MTTPKTITLIANGDLRLAANQNCWPAQRQMEAKIASKTASSPARNWHPRSGGESLRVISHPLIEGTIRFGPRRPPQKDTKPRDKSRWNQRGFWTEFGTLKGSKTAAVGFQGSLGEYDVCIACSIKTSMHAAQESSQPPLQQLM